MIKFNYKLLSFVLIILSFVSLVSAADPGHRAAAIGNGTFESGNYVFPGNLTVGTTQFFVNKDLGYVGIGTTNPLGTLEVKRVTAGSAIYVNGVTTSGTNYGIDSEVLGSGATLNIGGYFMASGGTTNYAINIPANAPAAGANNYAIYSASQAQSYIAGNVGIGTTAPSQKLDVRGDGNFSGTVYINNNTDISTLVSSSVGATPWTNTSTQVQVRDTHPRFVNVSGTMYVNDTSGNVGIGTTSPTSKLHISTTTNTVLDAIRIGPSVSGYNGANISFTGAGGVDVARITGWYGAGVYEGTIDFSIYKTSGLVNAMRITNGGNVGIGTTTPGSILNIAGNTPILTIENVGSSVGSLLFKNIAGSNFAGIIANSSSGEVRFGAYDSNGYFPTFYSNNSEAMRISTTGNVGIGTTSPFASLTLTSASDTVKTGYLGFEETGVASTRRWWLGTDTIDYGDFSIQTASTHGASSPNLTRLLINSAGNVGIGTTAPGAKLHVSDGNAPAAALIPSGPRFISSYQSGNNDFYLITSSDTNTHAGIFASSRTRGSLASPTAVASGDRLGASIVNGYDGTNMKYTLAGFAGFVDGTVAAGSVPTALLMYAGDGSTGTGGVERMRITSGGNVGIGTTSPAYKLDVNYAGGAGIPSARFTGDYNNNGLRIDTSVGDNSSVRNWFIGANTVEYGDFSILTSNAKYGDPIVAGTNRLYINKAGNVGIGTTVPGSRLEVVGTFADEGTDRTPATVLTLGDTTLPITSSYGSSFFKTGWWNAGANANSGILTFAVGQFPSYQYGRDVMTLLGNGNVGIGTTGPLEKLHVAGTALFASAGSNIRVSLGGNAESNDDLGIWSANISVANTFRLADWNTGTKGIVINTNNGNVGIGAISPSYKLEVNGNANLSNNLFVNSSSVGIGTTTPLAKLHVNGGDMYFGNEANVVQSMLFRRNAATVGSVGTYNSQLEFSGGATAGAGHMVITSTGNVGIGTTAPAYKLDVQGNISVNNSIIKAAGASELIINGNTGNVVIQL